VVERELGRANVALSRSRKVAAVVLVVALAFGAGSKSLKDLEKGTGPLTTWT
jgi:hypothetical protein